MTQENGAGASRRSRRLALHSAGALTIALALTLTIARGRAATDTDSWSVNDQDFTRTDAQIAAHLLESVQGANGVLCAAVDRSFNAGSWGMSALPVLDESANTQAAETARWIGKRHVDREALAVARQAFSSADPCVRRVAARIAGNVNVDRLDQELRSELSGSVPVRVAALLALGYAEQESSLPRLYDFVSDTDRSVRLAAIWAVGRVGDEAASEMMIKVLKSDADPDARRIAAWALGSIHD